MNPSEYYKRLIASITEDDVRRVAEVMAEHIGEENRITLQNLVALTKLNERTVRVILNTLVVEFGLDDYIAKLEAENRALRHALELRECEEMEHKPDPLDGVPYVSLSNAEIAAMTPDHPLYKLVKGKEERNGQ